MQHRERLINIVLSDSKFKRTCINVGKSYSDDVFQEVVEQILTMPESRLPTEQHLPFWFYCVARNIMSPTGKNIKGHQHIDISTMLNVIDKETETETDKTISDIEDYMIGINEFENRVIHLYIEHGNMSKVQRLTGISYSALRAVKENLPR